MNEIDKKQHEMYMANARPNARGPNTIYIPLLVLGLTLGAQGVGLDAQGVALGVPNAKLTRWGSRPMRGPNVSSFALQWSIGLR